MPKHDDKKKCYNVLGLDGTADEDDVKRAFTKLALTYHPDLCLKKPDEVAKHRYHDICKAFKRLSTDDSNVGEWNNEKSDEIFFSLLREPLQNCSRAGVLYSLLSSSLDAHSTFQNDNLYRCKEDVIEDDDDEAQYIQMLISILENRLKTGKSVPAGLTHDKISKLHTEFNLLKEAEKKNVQEKLSTKKAKSQPVSITKPKPKTKKQLMAEQRRRELEMSKIEQELEEKRKHEEERETARKQLESERQKKLEEQQKKEEEERKRQQQETRRKREKEEKEREAKLQKEKERQEKIRKQQEEEKKRKSEEKAMRLKAIRDAKEKEEREKQEVAKKSQQLKRQQQFQQYQQQQQKYPREVPPRFLKQQKGGQTPASETTTVSPPESSQPKPVKSAIITKPESVHTTPSPNPLDADEEWGGGIPLNDNWNHIASDVDDSNWQSTAAASSEQQSSPVINNAKQPSITALEEQQAYDLRTKSKHSLGNCSNAAVVGDSSSVGAIANNFGVIGESSNRNSPLWGGGPDLQRPDWTPRTSDSGASPLIVEGNDINEDKLNFTRQSSWSKAPGQPLLNKTDKLKPIGIDKTVNNKWPVDAPHIEQSNCMHETGTKLKIPNARTAAQMEHRDGSPHDDIRRRESATGSGSYGRELVENSRMGINLAGLDAKLDSNAKVTGWLATSPCMDEMETGWHETDSIDADMDGPGWEWTNTASASTSTSTSGTPTSRKVKTYAAAGAQGNVEAASSPSPSATENISAVADANLELLIDMGFPRESAEEALRNNNGVVETAINELLNDEVSHQSPPRVEQQQQQQPQQQTVKQEPPSTQADQNASTQPQKLNRKQRRKLQQQRQQQQQQSSSSETTKVTPQNTITTTSRIEPVSVTKPSAETENPSNVSLPSGPNSLGLNTQQPVNRFTNPAVACVEPIHKYPNFSTVSNTVDPILTSSYLGNKSMSLVDNNNMAPQTMGTSNLSQPYPITNRPMDPLTSSFPSNEGIAQSKLFKWKQGNVIPDRREAPTVSVDPISAKWGVVAAPKLSPTPAEFKPGVQWKSKADIEKHPQDRADTTAIVTPIVIHKPIAEQQHHHNIPTAGNAGNLLLHQSPIDHNNSQQMTLPQQNDQQSAFQSLWKSHDLRRSDPVPWLVIRGVHPTVNPDQLRSMCQHYGQLLNFFSTTVNCYARYETSQHAKSAYSQIHPRLSLMGHNITCGLRTDTDIAAELQRTTKQPLINQPSSSSSSSYPTNNTIYESNGLSNYQLSDRGVNTNLNDSINQGIIPTSLNGQTPWTNQGFPQQQQQQQPSNPWMQRDNQQSYGLLANPGQGLPGTYDIWNSGQTQAKLQQPQQHSMHSTYSSDFIPHTDLGALYTSQGS